jgi:Na+/melibiose symporter-like transporter
LIPDLVPEEQRGRASAVKSIFELIPIILLGLTVSKIVGAGHFDLGVVIVGAAILVIMLLTMVLVKEKPITKKPDIPLMPALVRVLGMLAGIIIGAVVGIMAGFLIGGLITLITWPLFGQQTAINIGVSIGGIAAMIVAVVGGVWAGTYVTLGKQVRKQPSFTWWVVNRLMFLAAITSIQGIALYFLMFAFNVNRDVGTSMNGTLMFVVGLCTLFSALPSGWLSDRIGQKRMVAIGGVLASLGTIILLVTVWVPNIALIYVGGIILGLSAGLWMTTNWALGTRLVPPQEAGRYLGISNLAGAGAGMIGAGMAGPIADFLNNRIPGLGYFAIFSGYAVLFLLSIVSLRWIHFGPTESSNNG